MPLAPPRVLHCPAAVGGHPQGLARAERAIGLASHSVSFVEHPLGFDADETLAPEGTPAWRAEWARYGLLFRALRDFDVIHFNFGRTIAPSLDSMARARSAGPAWLAAMYRTYASLLEFRDLPLLRFAGKRIAVTFQGDDARQGDECAKRFEINATSEVEPGYYTPESDARRRRVIEHFDAHADLIYTVNPDLLQVLPERARFVPYAHVDARGIRPSGTRQHSGPPVIVHAPTHRGVKGTRHILAACERLAAEGRRFELRLVEGMSRESALAVYQEADLLIDQLLLGWYGGVAVEFMAMGKPVACYVRPSDLDGIPPAMRDALPIIGITPESVHAVLADWLERPPSAWQRLGQQSRGFVERWHDPERIARQLARDYRGESGGPPSAAGAAD